MGIDGILTAFGGGILGAALGGLIAFEFVGLLVIAGVAIQLAVAPGVSNFMELPFGAFGPHVGGFASGVAAAAFAAKKGKLSTGKDIVSALTGVACPTTLLIGGVFGVLGYMFIYFLNKVPSFGDGLPWTDTVALTVVVSGILARILFGNTGIFGTVGAGEKRFSPAKDKRWVPYQSDFMELLVIGLGVGLFSGFLGTAFGGTGALLAFGIAAFSLVFLQTGFKTPITHHIALPAAIAAALSGSVIWAGIFGIACAFLGEFMSRLFLVHGDTHIDPPAATIVPMTTLANFFASAQIFTLIQLP